MPKARFFALLAFTTAAALNLARTSIPRDFGGGYRRPIDLAIVLALGATSVWLLIALVRERRNVSS